MATETLTTTTTAVTKAGERVIFPYAYGSPAGSYSTSTAVLSVNGTPLSVVFGISFDRAGAIVTPGASSEIPAGTLTLQVQYEPAYEPTEFVTPTGSSVARPLGDILGALENIVSLKTYGATGTGNRALDEAAWDAAFAAANVVYAPPGLYIVKDKVIPSGKTLIGAGRDTIFKHPSMDLGGGSSYTVRVLNGEDIRASNFTIDGNKAGITNGDINNCEGFSCKYGKNVHIDHITVKNTWSEGVDFDDSQDCSASYITGVDCGGMCIHISENNRRVFSYHSVAIRCGIASTRAAFDNWDTSRDCGIVNCVAIDCYRGFQLRGSYNSVRGFKAINCQEWGGWIDAINSTIQGVEIDGAGTSGLQISGSYNQMGKIVVGGVASGRSVDISGNNNTIAGLTVNATVSTCLGFTSGSADNTVSGVNFSGGAGGVFDQGTRNKIIGGKCEGSVGDAFALAGNHGSYTGLTALTSGNDGFEISGDYNTLSQCKNITSASAGFRVTSTADNTTLLGCDSISHTTAAISDSGVGTMVEGGTLGQTAEVAALTIATDAVAVKTGRAVAAYAIDTEGAAATDDLATITGGYQGQILILWAVSNDRTVVVKHGVGNIRLDGLTDFALDANRDVLTLAYRAQAGGWVEISRSNNGT